MASSTPARPPRITFMPPHATMSAGILISDQEDEVEEEVRRALYLGRQFTSSAAFNAAMLRRSVKAQSVARYRISNRKADIVLGLHVCQESYPPINRRID